MLAPLIFFATLSLGLFVALLQSWGEINELERLNMVRALALEAASDSPNSSWPRLARMLRAGCEGFLLYDPDVRARILAPAIRRQDQLIESYFEKLGND